MSNNTKQYNNQINMAEDNIREEEQHYTLLDLLKAFIRFIGYQFAKLLVKHPKVALYGSLAIIFVAIISVFAIKPNSGLSAHEDHINSKYFTTIQINSGDTLWDIAQDYISPEYPSTQAYVNEVIAINHISENDIIAGSYITIPYYAEEPRF